MSLRVGLGVERGDSVLARRILQDDLLAVIVKMSANAEQHAVILHSYRSSLLAFSRGQVVAGIPARGNIHPRRINILDQLPYGSSISIGIRDVYFQISLVVGRGGRVVHHGLDADLVVRLNAIAVARDFGPVGQLTARAE